MDRRTFVILALLLTACGASARSTETPRDARAEPVTRSTGDAPEAAGLALVAPRVASIAVSPSALPAGIARSGDDWTLVLHSYEGDDDVLVAIRARDGELTASPGRMPLGDDRPIAVLDGDPPTIVAYREIEGAGGEIVSATFGQALPASGHAVGGPPWSRTDHVPWFAGAGRGYVAWIETESRPMTRPEQVACSRHGSCSGVVAIRSRWVIGAIGSSGLAPIALPWADAQRASLSWIHGGLDAQGDLWLGYLTTARGPGGQGAGVGVQVVHVSGGAAQEIASPAAIGERSFVGLLHAAAGPVIVTARLETSPPIADSVLAFLDASGAQQIETREAVPGNASGAVHALSCGGLSWVVVAPMDGARHEVHALAFGNDGGLRSRAIVYAADEPGYAATGTSRASREPVMACADGRLVYAFVIPGTDPDDATRRDGTAVVVEWSAHVD